MKKAQTIAVVILCLIGIGSKDHDSALSTQMTLQPLMKMDDAKFTDWLSRWQKNILGEASHNYCSKDMGEDMGWLMFPMLKGFYFGYLTTGNEKWPSLLVGCTDRWIKRGITEPDGYIGWPKVGAAGSNNIDHLDEFYADSLLGEVHGLAVRGADVWRNTEDPLT